MSKFFATTLLVGVFEIAKSDCNWGLYFFFPLAEDECGTSTFSSDPFSSIMATCDDGNAMVYLYDDDDCTSEISSFNTTGVCDNTGSCDTIELSTIGYGDSMYCNGSNITGLGSLTLASLDDECIGDGTSFTVDDDGIVIEFFSGDDCSGTNLGNITIGDGCTANSEDSSTYVLFYEIIDAFTTTETDTDASGGSGSGSSENTTTNGNGTDSKSGTTDDDDKANGLFDIRALITCIIISIANNLFV